MPVVMHEHDQDARLEVLNILALLNSTLAPTISMAMDPRRDPSLAALCARVRQDPVRWTAPRPR